MGTKRYIVWHLPRTGSNYLMGLLASTGKLGVNDYRNCGFYIGDIKNWVTKSNIEWENSIKEYFRKQRTLNNIEGCKGDVSYFKDMYNLPFSKAKNLLDTFDYHFYLTRKDLVAQAVSRYWAVKTKVWNSYDLDGGFQKHNTIAPNPGYSYFEIQNRIIKHLNELKQNEEFFKLWGIHPRRIYYEDIAEYPDETVHLFQDILGVKNNLTVEPRTRRLYTKGKMKQAMKFLEGEL